MMNKTELLDLPNELFSYIFQYLKSSDLVQIFSKIPSIRLQSLIQPHIHHLDLSNETEQWIDTYLPDLLTQGTICALRLQDKHIKSISKYILSTKIQSMHIVSSDWTTDSLKDGFDLLRICLKQMTITFTHPYGKGDIASHLFQSDSQIEYLNVTGRFLYFDMNDIQICDRLTSLSIELEGIHRLFVLLEHLPQLNELKVKLRNEDRMVQPSLTSIDRIISNNVLHRVTFTGCTKYFDHLEHFFATFGSSIEHLSINIDLIYCIIDGKRLERDLLLRMPRLSTLDLFIHSTTTFCDPLKIETFQSSIWDKFNPIVYCYDLQAHEHTLFTFPYRFDRFKHLSNNCVSSWIANRSVSLCFDRVHVLSVIPTTPLKIETIQFIQNKFFNIKTLEFIQPIKFPEIEQDDEQNRMISYMDDDLLSNLTIQLPSITKFCFFSSSQLDKYPVFRRFIRLFPNLVSLQMYIGRYLYRQIIADEDKSIVNTLNRIQVVEMVHFYDGRTVLTTEELQNLFPNAKLLFDYNEI